MSRRLVDADALARLVEAVLAHQQRSRVNDPELRAAVADLITGSTPAPSPRAAVSPQEYADLHGISITTVYRRIADGTLPHQRLGRRLIIPTAMSRHKSPGVATAVDDVSATADSGDNGQEPTT